jgi:hypothetical protein
MRTWGSQFLPRADIPSYREVRRLQPHYAAGAP